MPACRIVPVSRHAHAAMAYVEELDRESAIFDAPVPIKIVSTTLRGLPATNGSPLDGHGSTSSSALRSAASSGSASPGGGALEARTTLLTVRVLGGTQVKVGAHALPRACWCGRERGRRARSRVRSVCRRADTDSASCMWRWPTTAWMAPPRQGAGSTTPSPCQKPTLLTLPRSSPSSSTLLHSRLRWWRCCACAWTHAATADSGESGHLLPPPLRTPLQRRSPHALTVHRPGAGLPPC